MEMREIAERVLFSESLEEKLRPGPRHATDDCPGRAIVTPGQPGRPEELRISRKGVRAGFPGIHRLDDDRERGTMLHFLGNHELLAAELMALVLLKFPDAPREYRAGVYAALREEQMHALMYQRRMRECGIDFGELPVNDYFWRLIAPMETPMDFVTRLNLTFEQANLDFARHYAGLFRQAGDPATAAVLETIYRDEIGHVGHGVKWFRRWKAQGASDWQAFRQALPFPLAPAKAKGLAPFNAEGRRLAGLDEDFIRRLEVCEQSRGRTPVVHWFNPNAEAHAAARRLGTAYTPNRAAEALEHDLEMVLLGVCRRDDAALLRTLPGQQHLARLKQAGFELPEIASAGELAGRKLGGLRPWAWSPDAGEKLQPLAAGVSPAVPWQWRPPLPDGWFSKRIGLELETELGFPAAAAALCHTAEEAWQLLQRHLAHGQALLKAPFSCAGKGHLRVDRQSPPEPIRAWLAKTLRGHGGVVVEPWLERVLDFSALYETDPQGGISLIGMTCMENDAAGRFLGTRVAPKWTSRMDPGIARFLYREARVMEWYQERIPRALPKLLPGYVGPLGVDAMVHRLPGGGLALRPVIELNVRLTMGRIALELLRKSAPNRCGRLRILRKAQLSAEELRAFQTGTLQGGPMVLNDPAAARVFLALWSVGE